MITLLEHSQILYAKLLSQFKDSFTLEFILLTALFSLPQSLMKGQETFDIFLSHSYALEIINKPK